MKLTDVIQIHFIFIFKSIGLDVHTYFECNYINLIIAIRNTSTNIIGCKI